MKKSISSFGLRAAWATAFGLGLALLNPGCGDEGNTRHVPDVSNIEVKIQLQRFDAELFALDTNQLDAGFAQLAARHPMLFKLFSENIIADPTDRKQTPAQALSEFVRAAPVRRLADSCRVAFPDLKPLEKDLSRLFQFYRYYFPDKPLPEVATIISEFGTDAFTAGDSLCGIGLDMFLGENFPGYNPEIFPDYIRRQFRPEYIPVRLAKALAQNIAGEGGGKSLIDNMLANGKLLYIVDCLLPETPDSLKLGYTRAQLEGCQSNEAEVWARILDQKLLYSTDAEKWRKMISPAPAAPIVFTEAPGEIGNWVGWRIVQAYMGRYPDTKVYDLLKLTDAQQFLEKAKYKPKRK